ncbi:hypothetical protein WJX73_009316 [Symbiochloris irregularis]|uniref:Protein kinase domain-containing protein n=1 Tax=Symbiochloris irregularis TaxID=706552 RepID=A0AAW1NUN5_9CHLO
MLASSVTSREAANEGSPSLLSRFQPPTTGKQRRKSQEYAAQQAAVISILRPSDLLRWSAHSLDRIEFMGRPVLRARLLWAVTLLAGAAHLALADDRSSLLAFKGLFANLTTLSISNSSITCCLPDEWGQKGNWPSLSTLSLNSAQGSSSDAQNYWPDWGSADAFPSLRNLTLLDTAQGLLPANWSGGFKKLEYLDLNPVGSVQGNYTLPPEWGMNASFAQLRSLSLGYAVIAAGVQLPSQWGSSGGFASLQSLNIQGLGGTLPVQWSNQLTNLSSITFTAGGQLTGSLPSSWGNLPLTHVELQGNLLEGPIPDTWARVQSLTLFPGNPGLCGPLSASNGTIRSQPNVYRYGNALYTGPQYEVLQSVELPRCGAQAKLVQFASGLSFSPIPFQSSNFVGWTNLSVSQSPPAACNWTGVICDSDNVPRSLNLSSLYTNMSLTDYNTFAAGYGTQSNPLASLSPSACGNLSTLQAMDLSSNYGLTGTFAGAWDFPELVYLNISNTSISGQIPSQWEQSGGLPVLQTLLASVSQLSGTLDPFALGLPSLLYLDVNTTNVNGSLPSGESGAVFSALQYLNVGAGSPPGTYIQHQSQTQPAAYGLTGQLPDPTSAFPNLTHLVLDGNLLTGDFPEWRDSLPSLQALSCIQCGLHGNVGLRGQSQLQTVRITQNYLTGSLPDEWSSTSPQLAYVDLSLNQLVGTLPSSWSALPFTYLSLIANDLTGTLPASWGCNGSGWAGPVGNIQTAAWLDLTGNNLTGTIPQTFGCNGSLGGLADFDAQFTTSVVFAKGGLTLSNNSLSGTIPLQFTQTITVAALLPGNTGLYNSSADDSSQSALFQLINTANSAWAQVNQVILDDVPTLYYTSASDFVPQIGLNLVLNRPYWANYLSDTSNSPSDIYGETEVNTTLQQANPYGFEPSEPAQLPFNEEGLGQALFAIKNSFPNFNSALMFINGRGWVDDGTPACEPWSGLTCNSNGHLTGINFSEWNLQGSLIPAWSKLQHLQSIDLSSNPRITGALPAQWTDAGAFPVLQTLLMSDDVSIEGDIPGGWASSWPQLRVLDLSRTGIEGSIPADWSQAGAFPALLDLNLSNTQLTGSLPAFGLSTRAAPNLQQLQLSANYFDGALPDSYSSLRQLQTLDVSTNRLTSTLPESWGSNGSLQNLASADLSANSLQGSLPNDWFTGGSLSSLKELDLSANALTGSIPWQNTALDELTIKPLNSRVCGTVPSGIATYNGNGERLASGTNLGSCPYKLGGGAIAGIVIGGVVAIVVVALLGWLWRRQVLQARANAKQSYDALAAFMAANEACKQDAVGSGRKSKLGHLLGQVYKARLDDTTEVAIKFLNPAELSGSIAAQRRKFEEEIQIMRMCEHPNIVGFLGCWVMADVIYMVQEFAERGDLFGMLSDDEYTDLGWYGRGRGIALDVAYGLRYLHKQKILHLDLKSPNVLLTEDYTAKISDVGLARILNSRTHLSKTAPGGTWDWQSPETILGERATFSADIWSYGVLLLEIITGARQMRGRYDNPRVPQQCPEEIAQLVYDCMNFEPSRRPSAQQVIDALEASNGDKTPK